VSAQVPASRSSLVSVVDIAAAAERIAGAVRRTPLLETSLLSAPSLFVKAESLQLTGSFKLRGASNAVALLSDDERARGVITHSSGNHGQALARAASIADVAATVVMPRQSPAVKQLATRRYGARVVLVDISERDVELERIQAETGSVFVPPFAHPAVIAGQGTIGLEIIDDLPDVATVVVPVSGGGLISGIAVAVKSRRPKVRVVGVEPELAGDLAEGFRRGARAVWPSDRTARTIADGLRVNAVGELNWRHIRSLVDDVVTVSEAAIMAAMRRLVLAERLVCEPSGAVAVAGCLEHPGLLGPAPAVAVVSGGNVDPALLAQVVTKEWRS
jgi:threonine dehydratase